MTPFVATLSLIFILSQLNNGASNNRLLLTGRIFKTPFITIDTAMFSDAPLVTDDGADVCGLISKKRECNKADLCMYDKGRKQCTSVAVQDGSDQNPCSVCVPYPGKGLHPANPTFPCCNHDHDCRIVNVLLCVKIAQCTSTMVCKLFSALFKL